MKRINLEVLRQRIRVMNRNKGIYKVLKEELSALGYWQNRPRGNPKLGHETQQSKKEIT